MQAAKLELNDAVDVREEGGCIVIEPIRQEFTLDQLLQGVTRENIHTEVDFGRPVGKESL
jgi:antitoxin MazE